MMFSNPYIQPATYKTHKSRFINRQFQLKYLGMIVVPCFLALIICISPLYYFLQQNYNIFIEIAYENTPTLVEHLQREFIYLNALLVASLAGVLLFFTFFGIRITGKIIAPIKLLRNHLNEVTRGRWHIRPLTIRDDDEFKELVSTYNYFFSSFKQSTQHDLDRLLIISQNPSHPDSQKILLNMIDEKSEQLNLPDPKNVLELNSSALRTPQEKVS